MHSKSQTTEPTIMATDFSCLLDCWRYALSDGSVVSGRLGDARVPAGIAFNERNQWGANQLAKVPR